MPNWALGKYVCVGEKGEIQKLYDIMSAIDKEHIQKNGGKNFGYNWFGDLVTALGEDVEKIYCRGYWSNLHIERETELHYYTESAWDRCNEVDTMLRAKFPSIKFYYIIEEIGCRIYYTNDAYGTYFPAVHFVNIEDSHIEFNDYAEAKAYVENIVERNIGAGEDLDKVLTSWGKKNNVHALYDFYSIVDYDF